MWGRWAPIQRQLADPSSPRSEGARGEWPLVVNGASRLNKDQTGPGLNSPPNACAAAATTTGRDLGFRSRATKQKERGDVAVGVASDSDVTVPPTETVLAVRVDVAALDREAYARCWEAAAKSQSPEVRAAAARYFAREAERKAVNPPVQRRKERLSQEDVDALLSSSRKPRRPLRIDHEFIYGLKHGTAEEREEIRAATTMAVLKTKANRDRVDELVRMYYEKGYVEVDDEEDNYAKALHEALAPTDL